MNLWAIRQGKAGVVLVEHGAEDLHRRQHLRRCQRLLSDCQHAVACEGVVQSGLHRVTHGTAEIDAMDLGAEMIGKRDDLHVSLLPVFATIVPAPLHVTVGTA